MPIVDISGFYASEGEKKRKIRARIQQLYQERLGMLLDSTTVTFITDDTAEDSIDPTTTHVMARLYSKKFVGMKQAELDSICDAVVMILEEEGGHDFNEAFPIPVMAMRGGTRPYKPPQS